MNISIAIPNGLLGPKIMLALGRAFLGLGHTLYQYDAASISAPPGPKPDLHLCYNLVTRWLPSRVLNVQIWGSDPGLDPQSIEAIVQRQRELDIVFFLDRAWLKSASEEDGVYSGRYLEMGTDTSLSLVAGPVRHKLGIFGAAHPGRIADVATLVHRGHYPALWGPGWDKVPMLVGLHQGTVHHETELLAAMSTCEVVGVLPRGTALPWSYWQAKASGARVAVGMDSICNGGGQNGADSVLKRTMDDVAVEILDVATEQIEKNKDLVITDVECDNPWSKITITFPHEGNTAVFDLKVDGAFNDDAIPVILRRVAKGVEDVRLGEMAEKTDVES